MGYSYNNERFYNNDTRRPMQNFHGDGARYHGQARPDGQHRKKSGSKQGVGKEGRPWISGWNKRQDSNFQFIAFPWKNTQEVTSKSGKVWQTWCAKCTVNRGQEFFLYPLYNVQSQTLHFNERGLISRPKTNYTGTPKKK